MKTSTVLVVDDDPIMRHLMSKMLRVRGIETFEAENGVAALKVFESGHYNFAAIVSDIRMPEMDGIELLKKVREKSEIPFVVFTGLTEVTESKQAFKLGATEFITKPLDKEDVLKIVAIFMKENSDRTEIELKKEPKPSDFREIKIQEFLSSSTLQSDIYIKLSRTKFVKIARKGEVSPKERLAEYRAKKIESLYVLEEDFSLYVAIASQLANRAVAMPGISDAAKIQLLQTSTKLMVEHCFLTPDMDKRSLDSALQVVESALKFAANDPSVIEQLLQLNTHSNRLYAHSVSVAFYSALLAKEHGWDSDTTLQRIALGGLFHDIGLKEIPIELLLKTRKDLTREEIITFESHCSRGREILMTVKGLPEEVAVMAMNHHEARNGAGYPRRLKGEQISTFSRLIHVVDKFCTMTNPLCPTEVGYSSHDALKRMRQHYLDEFDPAFLLKLMDICGVPAADKKAS